MKIVIPDKIDFVEADRKKLVGLGAKIFDDVPDSEGEIIQRISDAEVVTANYYDLTRSIIEEAKNLKYIISPAVGYEWIDIDAATERAIKVLNCPTWNSQSVAEHAFALLLGVSRKILPANHDLIGGDWNPLVFKGLELSGKTLGVVGYGKVGSRVAEIGKGFGMKLVYTNSKSSGSELDELMRISDFVCLCLPLNNETEGMIDSRRLELLKSEAFLINVARGAIIDQAALYQALKSNSFAGAGLDVFANEPLKGKVNKEIVDLTMLDNVLATPHIAASTIDALDKLSHEVTADILSCVEGRPQNQVN